MQRYPVHRLRRGWHPIHHIAIVSHLALCLHLLVAAGHLVSLLGRCVCIVDYKDVLSRVPPLFASTAHRFGCAWR